MTDIIKGLVRPEVLEQAKAANDDPYGGACANVAINVMKYLDGFDGEFNIGYHPDMTTTHGIICHCDNQGGITGFMAGAARNIVAACYKDGWKFWLADVISPYDISGDEVRDLDKRVQTLLECDWVDVTEEQIRDYVAGLVSRYRASSERSVPEEDDVCPSCGDGVVRVKPSENCSCHIAPPCDECVHAPLYCPLCETEWEQEEKGSGYVVD